jgi:hypothetical protein
LKTNRSGTAIPSTELFDFMATKIKPCKKCGSTEVKLWDCGYSSFNPGGGKCPCGHEVKGEAGCSPSQDDLAGIWNAGQKLTEVEKLRVENKRLRAKVRALGKSNV